MARGNAFAFGLSFIVVLVGLTTTIKTPSWIIVMSVGCLVFGWLLTATLITHITSEQGLLCDEPDVPKEFHAMSRAPITVRLQNPNTRFSFLFLTAEILTESDGNLLSSPPKFVGQLPVHSAAEFEWKFTARKRGEHILRGMMVRTSFPGSLISREFGFSFDRHMLALPVVFKLKPKMDQLLSGRKRAMGHQPSNPAAMEEFVGVRVYRAGDNPRNVSLTHSMRMPDYPWQLVVREFEDPTDDEVCVILDTAVLPLDADDANLILYRFEKAIPFAIALCRQLCELKHRVRFMACQPSGPPIEIRIDWSARDIPTLERELARVKPIQNSAAVRQLLQRQSQVSDAILLFVSLQEQVVVRSQSQDSSLWITPEWQASLIAEVTA